MGPLVEEPPLHGAQILLPLSFHMDQRPLPPTEGKVLETREGEKVLAAVGGHICALDQTPSKISGSRPSRGSMETS